MFFPWSIHNGRKFISFSIADKESYKPKDSEERVNLTTFFNCTYWLGTGVAKVLRKGASVDLIGRAWAKPYQDKNDNWVAGLNFNASQIRFTAYAPKAAEEGQHETTKGSKSGNKAKGNRKQEEKDDLPF